MAPIAKALTDEDIGVLAVYYGGLAGVPASPPADPAESAYRLNVLGDNERALPACINCHGMTGRGASPLIPRLTGQPKGYFVEQMNAFRTEARHNDDMGVMRAFARRLTPEEIDALGDYYAAARPAP
jgi:cytochrome c553